MILMLSAAALTGCVATVDETDRPIRPTPPHSTPDKPARPGEAYLGDWTLKSLDNDLSCSVKLQRLQGYGWGQTFTNGCYRFKEVPKISAWRVDEVGIVLQTSFGKENVARLISVDRNRFVGRMVNGERIVMTRK